MAHKIYSPEQVKTGTTDRAGDDQAWNNETATSLQPGERGSEKQLQLSIITPQLLTESVQNVLKTYAVALLYMSAIAYPP